ncbi:MAG: patatin family protein [Clostridiales bacterium]|nr:patatin family protein [Clostridiales bacterium]
MKLGIVMEGGASRTIFSCGVTDVFMDEELYPDYLIGVSAGIAYGVSYASAQRGRNAEFTRKYMGKHYYMGLHHFLNPKKRCYYNLGFDFDEVPNRLVPFDYEALANYPGRVVAVVTNIETGQAEYLDIPPYETRWETTIASCSLPVLFPPVEIRGNRYLDGGLADPVPYRKAMQEGCDRIIVILTRERDYIKGKETGTGIVNFAYRKHPRIVELMKRRAESYNQLSEELLEEEKKGNIFLIAPRETFGVSRTEGRWELLGKLYREGVDVATDQMGALREYLL